MLFSSKLVLGLLLCGFILGCKSNDQPKYAQVQGLPKEAAEPSATAPAPAGTAKIVIKGTKAGTSQQDIALALMAATRKLGNASAPAKRQNELSQARQAADAILGGDQVVLEGASSESVEEIAADLRKAGLLVTTSK
jgi:hypothetical protein